MAGSLPGCQTCWAKGAQQTGVVYRFPFSRHVPLGSDYYCNDLMIPRPLHLWLATAAVGVFAGNIAGDEPEDTALDACGLPRGYWQTSHCFRDSTHHTCCLLGPEARR